RIVGPRRHQDQDALPGWARGRGGHRVTPAGRRASGRRCPREHPGSQANRSVLLRGTNPPKPPSIIAAHSPAVHSVDRLPGTPLARITFGGLVRTDRLIADPLERSEPMSFGEPPG